MRWSLQWLLVLLGTEQARRRQLDHAEVAPGDDVVILAGWYGNSCSGLLLSDVRSVEGRGPRQNGNVELEQLQQSRETAAR